MSKMLTPLRRWELPAAAVLLSLAVIPMIPLLFSSFAVPMILLGSVGIALAYRTHNLVRIALAVVATASVLLAAWLIATRVSVDVRESGYLQAAVLLTSAAVLAALAGLTILLGGRVAGVLGLLAGGALQLGAAGMIASVHAQADPFGDNGWQSLSDALGAVMFGIIGCILAALAALVGFCRAQKVRRVRTAPSAGWPPGPGRVAGTAGGPRCCSH